MFLRLPSDCGDELARYTMNEIDNGDITGLTLVYDDYGNPEVYVFPDFHKNQEIPEFPKTQNFPFFLDFREKKQSEIDLYFSADLDLAEISKKFQILF